MFLDESIMSPAPSGAFTFHGKMFWSWTRRVHRLAAERCEEFKRGVVIAVGVDPAGNAFDPGALDQSTEGVVVEVDGGGGARAAGGQQTAVVVVERGVVVEGVGELLDAAAAITCSG